VDDCGIRAGRRRHPPPDGPGERWPILSLKGADHRENISPMILIGVGKYFRRRPVIF